MPTTSFPNQFVTCPAAARQQDATVVPAAAMQRGSQGSFVYTWSMAKARSSGAGNDGSPMATSSPSAGALEGRQGRPRLAATNCAMAPGSPFVSAEQRRQVVPGTGEEQARRPRQSGARTAPRHGTRRPGGPGC